MNKLNDFLTKCVAISTNDRDINKWKTQNHFEVVLPQYIKNIVSMRISKLTLPAYFYNFCHQYQNTKFQFRLKPSTLIPQNDIHEMKYYEILALNQNKHFEITIPDGLYCCSGLATVIENLMNNAVTDFLKKYTDIPEMYKTYDFFKCFNDDVKKKIWFGNTRDAFVFSFENQINYSNNCNNKIVFNDYSNWGLPYYLGFEKNKYNSSSSKQTLYLNYYSDDGEKNWLSPYVHEKPDDGSGDPDYSDVKYLCHYIDSPFPIKLNPLNNMYIEINRYNTCDELMPYSDSTTSTYNNDYSGKVNAFFENVPITLSSSNTINTFSKNDYLINKNVFSNPIERIKKLEFKFRTHNGLLINFNNSEFEFVMEFETLNNHIKKY